MAWSAETSKGHESRKCRDGVVSYLRGVGLDIGCGDEKVVQTAIGIDIGGRGADIRADLSRPDALALFSDAVFDYVFSSHTLEDIENTAGALADWWRVVKPGGHLILYCPDPDYYPRAGTPGANMNHKHDLYWTDAWAILDTFGNAEKVSASRHNDADEYSWQLVVRKAFDRVPQGKDVFPVPSTGKAIIGTEPEDAVLVIRYGGIGDMIFITPLLKRLKADGNRVIVNTNVQGQTILKNNPNVDGFIVQERDSIPNAELDPYWDALRRGFRRVINLSGSIEGALLKVEGTPDFKMPREERLATCTANYMDHTMALGGYPDAVGELPELHFTEPEHFMARYFRGKHERHFVLMWSLSGSSMHKAYPYWENVARALLETCPAMVIMTVGDYACRLLEFDHPRLLGRSGILDLRQSMMLTGYVDCVVGTETGILNAASCYDTPKVVILSHSTPDNLTKYWKNCTALEPVDCDCYPCHQIHHTMESCPLEPVAKDASFPVCGLRIAPQRVHAAIQDVYDAWKVTHTVTPIYVPKRAKPNGNHVLVA